MTYELPPLDVGIGDTEPLETGPLEFKPIVGEGSTVTVRFRGELEDETFKIVGAHERANTREGSVSILSPFSMALIGKTAGGPTVKYTVDHIQFKLKIKSVVNPSQEQIH